MTRNSTSNGNQTREAKAPTFIASAGLTRVKKRPRAHRRSALSREGDSFADSVISKIDEVASREGPSGLL